MKWLSRLRQPRIVGRLAVWVAGAAACTYLSGYFRSQLFGFSTAVLAFEVLVCSTVAAVCGVVVYAIGLGATDRTDGQHTRVRSILMRASILILLAVLAAETFCGYEEYIFRREVSERDGKACWRARWFPYPPHGIGYDGKTFYAHD